MYFSAGGYGWKGGHNSTGSPVASTGWVLAEGANVPIAYGKLSTDILLANPQSSAATVSCRFLLTDGNTVTKPFSIPAQQRLTITANTISELVDKAFSTVVTSDVPIVVERSMYWGTDTPSLIPRGGATCSLGIPQSGTAAAPEAPVFAKRTPGPLARDTSPHVLLPSPTASPTPK